MEKKECFGILEKVFPVGENDLREIVPECFECPLRTSCLKTALDTEDGIKMKEKILDRAATEGMVGRLRMWSEKKILNRQAEQGKKEKKKTWWK